MSTLRQLANKGRARKVKKSQAPALRKNPQKRAVCIRVFTTNPRKPNSARRKVTRVRLSNKKKITVNIPGKGHTLTKYSKILVRGGSVRDTPSVRYRAMRGKLDLKPWTARRRARSKYGVTRQMMIDFSNNIEY